MWDVQATIVLGITGGFGLMTPNLKSYIKEIRMKPSILLLKKFALLRRLNIPAKITSCFYARSPVIIIIINISYSQRQGFTDISRRPLYKKLIQQDFTFFTASQQNQTPETLEVMADPRLQQSTIYSNNLHSRSLRYSKYNYIIII